MGWTAAAIIGSAVIGGIASSKAASAQKSAAASAGAVSEKQYQQTREDLAPWRQIGGQAIGELGALYGFPQRAPDDFGNRLAGGTIDQAGNPVDGRAGNQIFDNFNAGTARPPSGDAMMITDPRYLDGETIMYGDPRYGDADPYKGMASVNPATGAQEFFSGNGNASNTGYAVPPLGEKVFAPVPGARRLNPGNSPRALPGNNMAQHGRGGDTEMAHVTPGEMVVPRSVANQPGVRNRLAQGFRNEGMNPNRYVVGGRNSLNPYTGNREFFTGGSGAGIDDAGNDFNDAFPGRERDLGGRGDGGGGSRIPSGNQQSNFLTNPSQGTQAVSPLPDDYYTQDAAIDRFYESPDYTINFDEGAKALEQSAAARGGLFSGNTGTALVRYGQDYGNRLYNQYANRLQSFAGFGQTAAAQTGQFGAYSAGQQGNALMAGGNAAAQGWIGIGNSINTGIGNALYYNQVN